MHPHFYFDSSSIKMFREITEDFNKLKELVDSLDFENMEFKEKDNLEMIKVQFCEDFNSINERFNKMHNCSMIYLERIFLFFEKKRIFYDKYFAQALLENDRYQNLVKITSNKEETKTRRKI